MLLVGFHRVGAGKGTLTYPQALDEALCFGWIDGLRRGLDAASYSIRFSPRRTGSIWSAVNLRHVARLEREGCMTAAGRAAFQARDPAKTLRYSFEVGRLELAPGFATRLAADRRARAHFDAMPPSYRRPAIHWIMTAKREATRARRFATLLACSRRGARIPPLDYPKRPERRPARSTRAASGIPASARKAAARRRLNPGKG
jgi:uncharacterized protein YdeI (YjbR/CyaY-like superfamily)